MTDNKFSSQAGIAESLRRLPDRDVPPELTSRIMSSLPPMRKTFVQRVAGRCRDFFTGALPVGPALAAASITLAFFGGMQVNSLLQSPGVPAEETTAVQTVESAAKADAAFFLGRSLLADNRPQEALAAFQRAALLKPDNPQYVLWQGAAYYALGDTENERRSYRRVMDIRPDYLPARLNLAHNLLQSGQPDQARVLYEEVLQQDPTEKTALYNRALAFHLRNERKAETSAWKAFLDRYRTGVWAYRALRHLYDNKEFSFRSYPIGYRSVILDQKALLSSSVPDREHEIQYLAAQLKGMRHAIINIVVFRQDDEQGAKEVAVALRRSLLDKLPALRSSNVRISWFGQSESMNLGSDRNVNLPAGVMIFSAPQDTRLEERI